MSLFSFRPWGKYLALTHDSYSCNSYLRTKPFPTQRVDGINNFVGAVPELNNTIQLIEGNECPISCRPKDHTDWIYC